MTLTQDIKLIKYKLTITQDVKEILEDNGFKNEEKICLIGLMFRNAAEEAVIKKIKKGK